MLTENAEKAAKRKLGFAMRTLDNPSGMLDEVKSMPTIAVSAEDLDVHPYLFNCQNGVIDLRSGLLLPHSPERLITKISPVSFNPDAKCPLFMRFMSETMLGDTEMIDYLGRCFGMALTGDTREQKMLILWGPGKNGKSVLMDVMAHIIGEYADVVRSEILMVSSRSIHNYIAEMKGMRFISANETPYGEKLNAALIKELTGGDYIKGRQLYQTSQRFRPEFLLTMVTNWKPDIEGGDAALMRRLMLVRFGYIVPDDKIDPLLASKLKEERDGILAWLVRHCLDWQHNGLRIPEKVRQEIETYRSDMDILNQFIEDCCEMSPDADIKVSDFLSHFNTFLSVNGEPRTSAKALNSLLNGRLKRKRKTDGWYYMGVTISPKAMMTM